MASHLLGMESFRELHSLIAEDIPIDPSQMHVETNLPKIHINVQGLHPVAVPKNEAALAFIPKEEKAGFWKKFLSTWRNAGLHQALDLLPQANQNKGSVTKIVNGLYTAWQAVKAFQNILMPLSSVTSCAHTIPMFSQTKDWAVSPVRCIAWHPHCNKMAVATRDDVVLVYTGATSVPVIARHSSQKDISCLAWRPLCSAQLAVGCSSGVGLWTVDPASLGTRPSASCLIHLTHSTSVNSVCWDPQGNFLASGSAKDAFLYIWNVENREPTLLQRFRGGGYTFLTWSPAGDRLFAATSGSVFKIWETRTWTAESWNVMDGHVQAACWSPCSTKLIFADSVQPTLYSVSVDRMVPLSEKKPPALKTSTSKAAVVVADLTEIENFVDHEVPIGGVVQDLAWDPRGERLAVLFRSSGVVALFRTRYTPTLNLFPCGVLRGQPGETASTMQFKPDFDQGALLTVVWSSGRVQHLPFSFLPQNVQA